jgi:hypothetical protein
MTFISLSSATICMIHDDTFFTPAFQRVLEAAWKADPVCLKAGTRLRKNRWRLRQTRFATRFARGTSASARLPAKPMDGDRENSRNAQGNLP